VNGIKEKVRVNVWCDRCETKCILDVADNCIRRNLSEPTQPVPEFACRAYSSFSSVSQSDGDAVEFLRR